MNDDIRNKHEEQLLERLLGQSGRGPTASPDAKARVYAAVHEAWRKEIQIETGSVHRLDLRSHRQISRWMPLALAAGLGLFALTAYWPQSPEFKIGAPFASITRTEGNADILRNGQLLSLDADLSNSAQALRVGDLLTTRPNSGVALMLEGGETLRIAATTELRVTQLDRVHIVNGTAYFDSNAVPAGAPLSIETAFGSVRHTGTQYQATVANSTLTIQVREGAIAFTDETRNFSASSGEAIRITRTGAPNRSTISSVDPAWQWATQLASVPEGGDRPLLEVLNWIARETGMTVQFSDSETERRAQNVVVSGLVGLTPEQALEALSAATAFVYLAAGDGRLLVSQAPR